MNATITKQSTQTIWRVKVLTATWLSYAGFYFCRKAFGIVKPVLKEDYHFTDLELAHIWSAYLVAYMLGQFLSAQLGRRVACRLLLLVGMAVSLCTNIAFGFVSTMGPEAFWLFVGFMIINGFAQATGWPANVGLLAKWTERDERGRVMALWGTCYQIGSILAKHSAAFFLGALGIAWSFWGACAIMLGVWVFFYFFGQETPESVGLDAMIEEIDVPASKSTPCEEAQPLSSAQTWERALPTIVAMGVLYFCFKLMRYALDSWAPILIRESFADSVDVATAGHLSTAYDWLGFLGVIAAGFASDKLFRSQRMPVTFIMALGTLIVMVFWATYATSNLTLFIISLGLLGFMMLGPDSLLSGTAAMDVTTKEQAVAAAGIINGLGSLGPVVQEELIGYLKTHHGNGAVFQLMIGAAALACAGSALLWWRTYRAGQSL